MGGIMAPNFHRKIDDAGGCAGGDDGEGCLIEPESGHFCLRVVERLNESRP